MQNTLNKIYEEAKNAISNASSMNDIEDIKLNYLSRKGELNSIKKNLKDLSVEEKKVIGALANKISTDLEESLAQKSEALYKKELDEKLEKEKIDITLPGDFLAYGKVHPLNQTIDEITQIFQGMGFSIISNENNPELETEYVNFDCLNFPADHPARDMQDTF